MDTKSDDVKEAQAETGEAPEEGELGETDAGLLGGRVRIAWMTREGGLRAAEPPMLGRLGRIETIADELWHVRDDFGELHRVCPKRREVRTDDDATPRWVLRGPVPAWDTGDEVRIYWAHRNATPAPGEERRTATVIDSEGDRVRLRHDNGDETTHGAVNGHQVGVPRDEPRWVIEVRPL